MPLRIDDEGAGDPKAGAGRNVDGPDVPWALGMDWALPCGGAPLNVDTGAGFVTPQNYEVVAKLATEALR